MEGREDVVIEGGGGWVGIWRVCDHEELQVLASEASIPINVSDLRRQYYSGKWRVDRGDVVSEGVVNEGTCIWS